MINKFLKKKKEREEPEKSKGKGKGKDAAAQASAEKPKKKLPIKKILIIVTVLAVLAGLGYGGYKFYTRPKIEKPVDKKEISVTNLAQEIIDFSFYNIRELYDTVIELNARIILLEQEMERLDKIAEAYPQQIKIVEKEKKIISKFLDKLKAALTKTEEGIESFYVSTRVNKEEGEKLIETKTEGINKVGRDILTQTDELASRISEYHQPQKSVVEKMKEKITGFF